MAKIIYNLSGIFPVDVDRKAPSLICDPCIDSLVKAEQLRLRILDANEFLAMFSKETETELFEKELAKLKNQKKETIKEEKTVIEIEKRFYAPKVFLSRSECEEKIQELNEALLASLKQEKKEKRKIVTETIMEIDEVMEKPTQKRFKARKQIKSKENTNPARSTKNSRRMGSIVKKPCSTPKSKISCDKCNRSFDTSDELNKHHVFHRSYRQKNEHVTKSTQLINPFAHDIARITTKTKKSGILDWKSIKQERDDSVIEIL